MSLYHFGVPSSSSQNGREESISSVTENIQWFSDSKMAHTQLGLGQFGFTQL
jgi:hypothetical protein